MDKPKGIPCYIDPKTGFVYFNEGPVEAAFRCKDALAFTLPKLAARIQAEIDEALYNLCQEYDSPDHHCTLCGNTGVIDTTGAKTPKGFVVGRKNRCICPNGRALKKEIFPW